MLIPAKTFFANLEDKHCTICGHALVEQADCYQSHCDSCVGTTYYTFDQNADRERH